MISIHASAKEATFVSRLPSGGAEDFNPRLREGGDHLGYVVPLGRQISIHASAKEATGIPPDLSRLKLYFNPRLREGGDGEIHARGPHSKKDFNPRLREGGDVF